MSELSKRIRIYVGRNITPLALVAALLIIVYATLEPFHFHFSHLSFRDYLVEFTFGKNDPFDFIRNILLFMPFGFILGAILERRSWSKRWVFLSILFGGLLLTLGVESLQQFSPYRQASIYDLIGNTVGSVVGLASYRIWRNRHVHMEWIKVAKTKPSKVLAGLAVYMFFLLLIANSLASSARIDSWDKRYHLTLGNEWTGDRPWIGSLQNLEVFNKALDIDHIHQILNSPQLALARNESLQAYYPLTGGGPYRDLTGKLPDLVWRGEDKTGEERAVYFDGYNWLATYLPAGDLVEDLEETSEFSIRLTADTADVEQFGPARILNISEDPFSRNLTIGQESDDLVIRFRSPLTGKNGATPQFLFPDFFNSSRPIDFAVVYDGLAIDLVDGHSSRTRSIELVPGVAFYVLLKNLFTPYEVSYSQITVREFYNQFYRLLFYSLVFFPVSMLLALRSVKAWPKNSRITMNFCSLFLVPLLVELTLVANSGFHVRPLNILIGIIVIAVISWVIMPVIYQLFSFVGNIHAV
jgi:glycopeptide antibiotics resistance protein